MPKSVHKAGGKAILNDLPFCIVRAAIGFRRLNDCILHEVGLKGQPLGAGSVMHALFEESDCTVKDLVNRTQISNGTLTGILDRLERDGLIRRSKNIDDGRSWLIRITLKGEAMREQLRRRHEISSRLFNTVFSPVKTARLKRDLARLTEAMHSHTSAGENQSHGSGRTAVRRRKIKSTARKARLRI